MTSKELYDRIRQAAREMNAMDALGALHIFVSDGNCEDEHLEFCLKDKRITAEERDFCQRMLDQFTEEQRCAVYAFSDCSDLQV